MSDNHALLIERAERRAYSLREDGRGFDAKLIEELIAALRQIPLEREARLQELEKLGLLWRNPAPCAAPSMVGQGSIRMTIDATGVMRPASAMSASGQDAEERLEAQPASAVPERQTPQPVQSPPLSQGDE